MGQFTSQGTKYSIPDNRWASVGASLAEGMQKRMEIQSSVRIQKEKEDRILEKEMQILSQENEYKLSQMEQQNKYNQAIAPYQYGNIDIVQPPEDPSNPPEGVWEQSPGTWVQSKPRTNDAVQQYRENMQWAAERASNDYADAAALDPGFTERNPDQAAWIANMSGKYAQIAGHDMMSLPQAMWPDSLKADVEMQRALSVDGEKHKRESPYIDKQGALKWSPSNEGTPKDARYILKVDKGEPGGFTDKKETKTKPVVSTSTKAAVGLTGAAYLIANAKKAAEFAKSVASGGSRFAQSLVTGKTIAPVADSFKGKAGIVKDLIKTPTGLASKIGTQVNPVARGYLYGKIAGNLGSDAMEAYNPEAFARHGEIAANNPWIRAFAHPWAYTTNPDYRSGEFADPETRRRLGEVQQ